MDIEEKDGQLRVTEHNALGSCRAECRTAAKACEDTVGEADTKACAKKPLKFQSITRKDEEFQVMSEDEKKAQEYMKRARYCSMSH